MNDRYSGQNITTDVEKKQPRKGKADQGIIYLNNQQDNTRNAKTQQQDSVGRLQRWILLLEAIIGLTGGVITLLTSLKNVTLPPVLEGTRNLLTASGALISATLQQVGPWYAAAIILFAGVVLRLIVERIGLFYTWSILRDRSGLHFLILSFVFSCLLLLPLPALWVAIFYATVPPWSLAIFGIAYVASMLLAYAPAAGVIANPNLTVIHLGQTISVVSCLATILIFRAQSQSQMPTPLANPWIVATMVLLAAMATRLLAELAGFFVTIRVNLGQIITAALLLSPLPALWAGIFYTLVPIAALLTSREQSKPSSRIVGSNSG